MEPQPTSCRTASGRKDPPPELPLAALSFTGHKGEERDQPSPAQPEQPLGGHPGNPSPASPRLQLRGLVPAPPCQHPTRGGKVTLAGWPAQDGAPLPATLLPPVPSPTLAPLHPPLSLPRYLSPHPAGLIPARVTRCINPWHMPLPRVPVGAPGPRQALVPPPGGVRVSVPEPTRLTRPWPGPPRPLAPPSSPAAISRPPGSEVTAGDSGACPRRSPGLSGGAGTSHPAPSHGGLLPQQLDFAPFLGWARPAGAKCGEGEGKRRGTPPQGFQGGLGDV